MLARLLKQNALDRRTFPARMLEQLKADLMEDAGGRQHVTARELILIERTAALVLLCSSIENYVFSQERLIDKHGQLPRIIRDTYQGYQGAIRANLVALGLKPSRPVKDVSLPEYLQQQAQQPSERASA